VNLINLQFQGPGRPQLEVEHIDLMPGALLGAVGVDTGTSFAIPGWYWLLSAASSGLSAYHGYKRDGSLLEAAAWGLLGGIFPVIVPAIAVAQGFGEPR